MIKAEKTGNKMKLEVTGDTQDLICEFNEVLKAMYKVLDKSILKSAPLRMTMGCVTVREHWSTMTIPVINTRNHGRMPC